MASPTKEIKKALPQPNSDFYELVETLPAEAFAQIKELNIGGVGMKGYDCRGGSAQLFGLIAMEMARIDCSIATFFGVHNGLAMGSIYLGGSEEQKREGLPPRGPWGKIG